MGISTRDSRVFENLHFKCQPLIDTIINIIDYQEKYIYHIHIALFFSKKEVESRSL